MRFNDAFKNKYRRLIETVTGFEDLSWYKKRHLPKILQHKERYKKIADQIGVPLCLIPLLETKEMASGVGKFDRYIGNGQPLNKKTTWVPKNRGPFRTWEDGVVDALVTLKGFDKIKDWTEERLLFECERYNGFGYYNRGKESAYLWSKTKPHTYGTGKFVRDGVYDPDFIPKNIGIWAMYKLLIEADRDFKLGGGVVPPIHKPEDPKEGIIELITNLIKDLIEYIGKNYEPKAEDSTPPREPFEPSNPTMYRNKAILTFASGELGVKEIKGSNSNLTVEKYLDHGYSKSNGPTSLKDDTPWCAGFIAYILEANPFIAMGSTNSLMARSYERWGVSTKSDPCEGDVATMWRKSKAAGTGHVTFFLGWHKNGQSFYGLGGNQSDEVNVSIYSTERLTDFRRSSKSIKLGTKEKAELKELAKQIRDGKKIIVSGSLT